MSILDSASSRSVDRGYIYYKNGNVISYSQLSDYEYDGEVQGTKKEPYYVKINTRHPKSSFCNCPFANGNTICKHMVALFLAISPEDLADYEEWIENDYEDEYEENEDDYYDDYYNEYNSNRYENYKKYKSDFIKPILFDEMLSRFVDNLSEKELKNILVEELKKNEEYTFDNYLKKEYKKYSSDKNNIYVILDKLNKNFYKLSHNYDYNNKDYTINFLTNNEKQKISNAYIHDDEIKAKINKIFFKPELATYNNYKWFATLYKNNNNKMQIDAYITKLKSFFDTLKHYSIRNTLPKSNVLIVIYLLKDLSIEEIAKTLVKNCKYIEYDNYIIKNIKDINKLYEEFNKVVENEKYINKEYIAKIYYKFYIELLDEEIYNQYLYYDFLYSKDINDLIKLKNKSKLDYYLNKMLENTKDIITLEKIYLFLDDKEKLFKLLFNQDNEYSLMANIENLKDKYNDELLQYLKKRFYEVVAIEKSRSNYKKAATYVEAISRLNDGKRFTNELINELRNSEYSKRIALFDEINKVIK